MVVKPFMRLLWALRFSLRGLLGALRTEEALRLELIILAAVIPVALILEGGVVERALLIGSWMAVIVVELINTAIETTVDRIGSERNELSGRAKDLGSAAVLCTIITAGVVWLLILIKN